MHHGGYLKEFWLCFVPLFVAVDALGTLPIFAGLVGSAEKPRVNRVIKASIITALAVALPFLFLGELMLQLLGITVNDFMIAGGAVLFMLSIRDLLSSEKRSIAPDLDELGPVPIGVPLIVGPAVLTTIMLLSREYGFLLTAVATVLNILLAGLIYRSLGTIMRIIGNSGAQIASKIANLLLAAIAVMLIRKGLLAVLKKGIFGW
jgi:multiple antibiotic resistance protein